MKKYISFLFFTFISFSTIAQLYFKRNDSIPVFASAARLKNPWAGGINFGQFSTIDLNLDGKKDLFIFDRSGNKISTYINQSTPNTVDYKHAFEYQRQFPPLHDWAILADYNCDGKEDIFTYATEGGGIEVHRNDSDPSTGLKFTMVSSILYSDQPANLNLYISSVDIPAITDVDGDGDLDILTFIIAGSTVQWHENFSMDLFGHCDSLKFVLNTSCWGNFYENPSNNSVTLNKCRSGQNISPVDPQRHAGSCEICLDLDGDKDKEIILGDLSHNNLVMLHNGGTAKLANMTAQDTSFPVYDTPVDHSIFPCAYHLDVDNDGLNDLIVSPNAIKAAENKNSVLYYKNISTSANVTFKLQQRNFLQDGMIETGEGAYPVFFDYNSDGLKDIVVANYGYFRGFGMMDSKLSLFKNTGTTSKPEFEFVTDDYLQLSTQLGQQNMVPAFGDLDGDGDEDLVVGDYNGVLHHFENTAGAGNAATFTLTTGGYANIDSIDVGTFAVPQIIDINRDGLKDLLIGEGSGTLNYYRNKGTLAKPHFTYVTNKFGGIDVTEKPYGSEGYSYPFLYDQAGSYGLLVGSGKGYIHYYTNIDGNLSGNFALADSTYLNIWEGIRTGLHCADVTNDGLYDMIIGNYAGGLGFYSGYLPNSIEEKNNPALAFFLFPNPASAKVSMTLNEKTPAEKTIVLLNAVGQEVLRHHTSAGSTDLDVSRLASGIYFCRVSIKSKEGYRTGFQKLLIQRLEK